MATASSAMTPDFEVKFLLDSSVVLSSAGKPTDAIRSALSLADKTIKINVQFLDTPAKELYNAGWSPRVRKVEGKAGWELTYKKRYPIGNDGNPSTDDIANTLLVALGDGFGASDSEYEAQVEWGFAKQTLSISRKKNVKKDSVEKKAMDLPDEEQSRKLLIGEAPGKFSNWQFEAWGTGLLKDGVVFGPVYAKRYEGKWEGTEVDVEVWPIKEKWGSEDLVNVVEVSFKSDSSIEAKEKHDALEVFLKENGWLVPQDSLKTQLIMDRYGPTGPQETEEEETGPSGYGAE
ncbi:hypothetical protein QBC38DRAFT_137299 [Podospora fimiseda]|uniref:CYTH domain-containing protein n=1 Tax=Podospora fimiseda TaxID=252190 RepID=A0AAN6YRS9_9PEZI|nr:hypothetical protein QBC38DRAFT_137299 [Podospora fimiseda]